MLDLRVPTGFFFALAGLTLVALGVVSPYARAALTDVNINLYCGMLMVAFGGVMLFLAWRAHSSKS